MTKIFYILLLSLTLPLLGFGQSDTTIKRENTFKNQIDLDIYFLGIETSFKKRVTNKLFTGIGLRGLMYRPVVNLDLEIEEDYSELIAIRPFLDFQISNNFHIETGLPFSMTYRGDDTYGLSTAIEAGIFLKLWIFEIGLRPSLLFFKDGKKFETGVITNSLLILKTPLSRW